MAQRLGHIGEKELEIISRKGFLPSLAGTSLKTYVHCLARKTHKVAFKSFFFSFRKSQILDLIHTDVCMMQSRSIGSALYFMVLINDCSRKVWDFALKSKDKVLDIFKFFHTYVERG